MAAWLECGMRGIVEVTTGAGKTRLALACVERFIALGGERVVIVVPSIALQDQWHLQLRENLEVSERDICLVGGGASLADGRKFTIAVINSARSLVPRIEAASRTFLIVDEVHRAGSPQNVRALQNRFRATLGMSATPDGSYDERLDQLLVPALGRVFFRYSLSDALRDGIVTPFVLTNVEIALSDEEQHRYDQLTTRIVRAHRRARVDPDVRPLLKTLLQRRAIVAAKAVQRIPAAVKLALTLEGNHTIVFHEYIAHARLIAAGLDRHGLRSCLYTSRESAGLRIDNLRLFRRGHFDVLVACRALDEGLDVPDLSAAIIASGSAAKRQRIQRLGRVVRVHPGKSAARIFTIYGTLAEKKRLRLEQEQLRGLVTSEWTRMSRRR